MLDQLNSLLFACWANGERAVDVVYFDFSKAFDTVSHNIVAMKLRKYGMDGWTVRLRTG